MNLRHLQFLRLVVEHGSHEAAARAAGVSQPAVSYAMQQLAKAVGVPLFETSGRRRVPTAAARALAARRAALDEHLERLSPAAHSAASRDVLRVGATPSAALVCGAPLHALWSGRGPGHRLEISSAHEGRLLSAVQRGELDMAIAPRPRGALPAGLRSEPLYAITPLAYARRGHPLAGATTLAELRDAAWAIVGPTVSGPVDVLTEAHAVRRLPRPRVAVSCPDYASMLDLMVNADLLGVLPHPALLVSAARGAVLPLRLREALPRYEMSLVVSQAARRAVVSTADALGARLSAISQP